MRSIRSLRYRLRGFGNSNSETRAITCGVWDVDVDYPLSAPYVDHVKEVLNWQDPAEKRKVSWEDPNNVVELVSLLKDKAREPLQVVKDGLTNPQRSWMPDPVDDISARRAINLAVRIWLFVEPETLQWTQRLRDVVHESLPKIPLLPLVAPGTLSDDFSAKTLARKAGIRLIWTSSLSQHLTLVGNSGLKVFRHARVLRIFAESDVR